MKRISSFKATLRPEILKNLSNFWVERWAMLLQEKKCVARMIASKICSLSGQRFDVKSFFFISLKKHTHLSISKSPVWLPELSTDASWFNLCRGVLKKGYTFIILCLVSVCLELHITQVEINHIFAFINFNHPRTIQFQLNLESVSMKRIY